MNLPEIFSSAKPIAGFTLIELMLVVSLGVLVTGVSSLGWLSYYQAHVLQETTDTLVSNLRTAQGFAVSGKYDQPYGVSLEDSSYTLFVGDTYDSRRADVDTVFPIPSTITVSGPQEIVFSPLTGMPNVVETITISIGNREKRVSILASGYIDT